MRKETWNAVDDIRIAGKTDWLGMEKAIRAVLYDVAYDESQALNGIRLISDIIGKGTGRGYQFSDVKRAIESKE